MLCTFHGKYNTPHVATSGTLAPPVAWRGFEAIHRAQPMMVGTSGTTVCAVCVPCPAARVPGCTHQHRLSFMRHSEARRRCGRRESLPEMGCSVSYACHGICGISRRPCVPLRGPHCACGNSCTGGTSAHPRIDFRSCSRMGEKTQKILVLFNFEGLPFPISWVDFSNLVKNVVLAPMENLESDLKN